MNPFNISNTVLEKLTGLPSKNTFLKDHVVPAKEDDKFNNNKCVQCWDEYTEEHPGVKISPCGHVFGQDCLHEMVNGPTGDLCPYCRVKLFRRNPTIEDILESLLTLLVQAYIFHVLIVREVNVALSKSIRSKYPWLRHPFDLIMSGLAYWATEFVRHHTDIGIRNPKVNIAQLFQCCTAMVQLQIKSSYLVPVLLPVYFLFGTTAFKVSFLVSNLALTILFQGFSIGIWGAEVGFDGGFENDSDRNLVIFITAIAIAFQQLVVIGTLWPVSTFCFAWTTLATVAWC